jgi:hypothetical protein
MSGAHILHFGEDSCYHVPILRNAGYVVEECQTLGQLAATIDTGRNADLLCVSETPGLPLRTTLEIVRPHWQVPIVLFRTSGREYDLKFDLEIPALTPPSVWLEEFHRLVAKFKADRERTRALIAQSQTLSAERAEARARSRKLVQKVRENRSRWEKRRNA